jgi:alpha-N-arabinofuranosidase
MISQNGRGIALRLAIDGPGYESKSYGYVNYIDASAIWNQDKLSIFIINRSLDKNLELSIQLGDRQIKNIQNCAILSGKDPKDANSFENPELLSIENYGKANIIDDQVEISVPILSFITLTLGL